MDEGQGVVPRRDERVEPVKPQHKVDQHGCVVHLVRTAGEHREDIRTKKQGSSRGMTPTCGSGQELFEVGLGWVGSGRVGSGGVQTLTDQVGLPLLDPTRLDPTRDVYPDPLLSLQKRVPWLNMLPVCLPVNITYI